jgi:hypothetical protein
VKVNLEIFPVLVRLESEGFRHVSSLIENNLEKLWSKIKHYFLSLSTQVHDWLKELLLLIICSA